MHFEATEENKLIYTDIFKRYTEIIETYLSQVKYLPVVNELVEVE
jgi:hypothetical protein